MASSATVNSILFVCTGNTCRSPMAAAIARRLLDARSGMGAPEVRSAGVMTGGGAPATPEAVRAAAQRSADLGSHVSSPLTEQMVQEAGLIYCMTMDHARRVLQIHPGAEGRVFVLDPEGHDLDDPIGGPQELYDRTAEHLEKMLRDRIEEWLP